MKQKLAKLEKETKEKKVSEINKFAGIRGIDMTKYTVRKVENKDKRAKENEPKKIVKQIREKVTYKR